MIFLGISILAGFFTVLAPCILPLLPIVIGASEEGVRYISRKAVTIIASLSVSVVIFTLLLKTSTLLIDIPQKFWNILSGLILVLVGMAIVFPAIWAKVPFIARLNRAGNIALGKGFQQSKSRSYRGDIVTGLALGPVFSTCSPTYLFIIATVLPAGILSGLVYLLGFTCGLALSLLCIAYFGQTLMDVLGRHMSEAGKLKKIFGVLIVIVGLSVLTGLDKKVEAFILDSGYGATINLEHYLIDRFAPAMSGVEGDVKRDIHDGSVGENENANAGGDSSTIAIGASNSVLGSTLNTSSKQYETIVFAGGCFWCTEAYFQEQPGIVDAVSGYAGGSAADASYLKVAKGTTGHREAVQVTFDAKKISLDEVLDIYWSHIDPTDTGGQFADRGHQYTTAIYFTSDEQRAIALDSKSRLEKSKLFNAPIATEIVPFNTFFKAEEYHQDYYKKASEYYKRYKEASGRAGFVEETWAKDAAKAFLKTNSNIPMNNTSNNTSNNDTTSNQSSENSQSVKSEQRKSDTYAYTDEEIAEKLKHLDPLAYHVVAENGTESPFNNAYWDNKADGIYVDIVTGKPLFSSTHKYDSGTGWPSFWRTIDDDSVTMHEDNSLSVTRTEIRSEGGHVGHVFEDGPKQEGGRRFCTNSASLRFVPKADMQKEGYGQYLYLFENENLKK